MPNIQAIKQDNGPLTRIIKYIPAEMITLYASCMALFKNGGALSDEQNIFKWLVIALVILTPLWKYYAVKDNDDPFGGSKTRAAIFHAVIATISFCIYIYVADDNMLASLIGDVNPTVGAIALLIFSTAVVPLAERIFLKQSSPTPPPGN